MNLIQSDSFQKVWWRLRSGWGSDPIALDTDPRFPGDTTELGPSPPPHIPWCWKARFMKILSLKATNWHQRVELGGCPLCVHQWVMRDLIKIKVYIFGTLMFKIQQTDMPRDTIRRDDLLLEDIPIFSILVHWQWCTRAFNSGIVGNRTTLTTWNSLISDCYQ